ncbi:hypothetical protein GGQ87_000056 [Brevundimonas alba]|uniref:Uncharacterized protein n=1 Tax=Brevundimonas alba TaxID=74314 RepID=A0A7X5YH15_9CAUL|nr:DUF5985 family protein [Brevundimonas alba]NJC39798.1 hypothetical protein [Brevundimonas alba]
MNLLPPALIYSLCLLTSGICALLLIRSWRRSRQPLLLWSAGCFSLLALNNLAVVMDMVILPDVDFSIARQATALCAVAVLLYGFIWEVDR